MAVIT
jgi:hypothetical protein